MGEEEGEDGEETEEDVGMFSSCDHDSIIRMHLLSLSLSDLMLGND